MLRNGWYIVSGLAALFVLDKFSGALWFTDGPFRWSGFIGEALGRGLSLFAIGYVFGGVIYLIDRSIIRRACFANLDTRPRFRNGWYCLAGIALAYILGEIGAARVQSARTGDPIIWSTLMSHRVVVLLLYAVFGTLLGGVIYLLDRFLFRPYAFEPMPAWKIALPRRLKMKIPLKPARSAVGIVIVVCFAFLVWPTVYQYEHIGTSGASHRVRIHRLSGQTDFLTVAGWKRWGGDSNAKLVSLPVNELPKLQGEANFHTNELSCTIYNGTKYQINEIVINVTVTRLPDIVDRVFAEQRGTRPPPPGVEIVVIDRDYRLKRGSFTDPLETGIFSEYVGFEPQQDQKWSWHIKSAKGTLP